MKRPKTIVLLSGGQDSTTCLYWARRGLEGPILALSFDYGQRHRIELERAAEIAAMVKVEHRTITVDLQVPSFLTNGNSELRSDGLPATFVPGRNLIFLAHAYAIAGAVGARAVVFGANAIDYSGYPDCRPEFVNAMARAGDTALDRRIHLVTPLLYETKAGIVKMGETLGARAAIGRSWSCYDPHRPIEPIPGSPGLFYVYDEPLSCAQFSREGVRVEQCAACTLRAKGFAEAGITDPALESPPARRLHDITKEEP